MENSLARIRSVADYQFGKGTGSMLFPDKVEILYSPRTGRIRYINLDGERLATMRPTDGLLSLSIKAAKFLAENHSSAKCFVTIQTEISEFIAKGGDVFAVHVVSAPEIHAKDEVIVVDEEWHVLAVGRAMLSDSEMKSFKTGVAVKVRHGVKES